jgi:hypothetical protein
MNVHGTLKGKVCWEVLSDSGLIIQAGEQSNLILNQGLDNFADTDITNHGFNLFREYLYVGTGSDAPAITNTALQAQAGAQTASDGGFAPPADIITDDIANSKYVWTQSIVRVWTATAPINLTEFGFGTATILSIRELFRDVGNNPIPITLGTGQQIRITHTLTCELPRATGASSFTITGTGGGTQSGSAGFWATVGNVGYAFFAWMPYRIGGSWQCMPIQNTSSLDPSIQPTYSNLGDAQGIQAPYTLGSFIRQKSFVFAPAVAIGNHGGWSIGESVNESRGGYRFRRSSGNFSKTGTRELTLNYQSSWGRA